MSATEYRHTSFRHVASEAEAEAEAEARPRASGDGAPKPPKTQTSPSRARPSGCGLGGMKTAHAPSRGVGLDAPVGAGNSHAHSRCFPPHPAAMADLDRSSRMATSP